MPSPVPPHRVEGPHSYRLRLKKISGETMAEKPRLKTERGKKEYEIHPLSWLGILQRLWILQK